MVELVGRSDLFDRMPWKFDAVALGKRLHHLGLESSLNMKMQFGLRQGRQKFGQVFHLRDHKGLCSRMHQ